MAELVPRVNAWLPQGVYDTLRRELPNVNVSKLLQMAIEDTLGCSHDQLACSRCGSLVDHQYLLSQGVTRFYSDARNAVGELALKAGTAEGALRVLQDVAKLWHGQGLVHWDQAHAPLPRPSRGSIREAIWQRRQSRALPTTHRQLAEDSRRAELRRAVDLLDDARPDTSPA